MTGRLPTGVRRLDELLKGGVPRGSFTLVYGPPFIGKETLGEGFFIAGLEQKQPGIMVVTNRSVSDVRNQYLERFNGAYSAYEDDRLPHWLDTYSRSIGGDEELPNTVYVDSLMDLNTVSATINEIQKDVIRQNDDHRMVFDSISTLAAYTDAQTTFRFLQVFIGRAKRAGATGMILIDEGMHTDAEVRMLRHLVDGVLEFKEDAGHYYLRLEGLGITQQHGWLEYSFDGHEIDIIGSFAAGRIR